MSSGRTTSLQWHASLLLAALMLSSSSSAQDAGVDAVAEPSPPRPSDPRAEQVHALVAGTLDVRVDPQSLFEVDLSDESAMEIESVRIRALDADAWREGIALDRARADFFALSAEQRRNLLAAHAERVRAAALKETEVERIARQAEAERQRALQALRDARSEGERLVAEELARLIAAQARVDALREHLRQARLENAAREDNVLGWQRRARDARASSATQADAMYDAIRATLRTSRVALSQAIDALQENGSSVPPLGPDPLVDIPHGLPTEAVRERRAKIRRIIEQARVEELAVREQRAAELFFEVDALNRERLGLLAYLSTEKRDAVTGFTAAGWDQARCEAFHLTLILRYHQSVAARWISGTRDGELSRISLWKVLALAVPWLLLVGTFFCGGRHERPS